MARVITVYSLAGRGKTTFALSGKGRKAYFEFDPGSYERAESGLFIPEGSLDIYRIHPPFDDSVFEDWGELDTSMVGKSGAGPVKVVHKLKGYEEKRREFRSAFSKVLKDESITDIILDTEDDLWDLEQNAFKQRIQEETNVQRSGNISRLEYQECNTDMNQYTMGSKSYGKNLIMVCHQSEVWSGGEATGQFKPAGWNEAVDKSDATLEFRIRDHKPYAVLKKAGGADLALVDKEITNPTLDRVISIIEAAAYLRKYARSEELPDDVDDILKEAQKLKFVKANE